MSLINIFCYGSNLLRYRIESRIGKIRSKEVVKLYKYKLNFHKKSTDGSSKANIQYTGNEFDYVLGIIIQIDEYQKAKLDKFEGKGKGYNEQKVLIVKNDDTELEVATYIANSESIEDNLLPYDWYKAYIVLGALENRFSDEYIIALKNTESKADSKFERNDMNWGVIKSSLMQVDTPST